MRFRQRRAPSHSNGGTFQAGANLSFANNFSVNTLGGAIDTFGKTLTLTGVIGNGNGTTGPLNVESSTGSGTLTLTGANTYTGATNVNTGTLLVNGSLASNTVNVNAGGILGGTGTIGTGTADVDVAGGGTLMPGSPTTPLTINGSLTMSSASLYMVTISGANGSYANVTGTATLGGAGLVASSTSTNISLTQAYKVLTAGTVVGTFSTPVFNVQGVGLLQAINVTNSTETAVTAHVPARATQLRERVVRLRLLHQRHQRRFGRQRAAGLIREPVQPARQRAADRGSAAFRTIQYRRRDFG